MKKRLDPLPLTPGADDAPRGRLRAEPRITVPARIGHEISADPRARLLARSRADENLTAPVVASLLTHLLVALALFWRPVPRKMLQEPPSSQVAVVWQQTQPRRLALPHPGTFKNAPPAEARPGSRGGYILPPAAAPSPAQLPQQETEAAKAPEAKTPNARQAEAIPKMTPQPRQRPHRASPPQMPLSRAFANLTNLNMGVTSTVPQSLPGANSANMPGPAPPGHTSMGNSVDMIDAPNADPDWEAEMRAWVEARDYYPMEAVAKHEEGTSTVKITIDKTGKVVDLVLVGQSGFDPLDDAWLSVFRYRTVPTPTPDMMQGSDTYTFRASLEYVLIEEAVQ